MDKTGYIYVLTNKSFHMDNWVKIGYTEDVDKRVRELSNTSVPLPYEIYCIYEIPRIQDVRDPDKQIHRLIQILNPNLRISQNREFFELYPWEAYNMLGSIAEMHGRQDKLYKNEANLTGQDAQNESEYSVEALYPLNSSIYLLYNKIKGLILSIDSSLEEVPRLCYVTFKRNKSNAISLWPKNGWIEIILHARTGQLTDETSLLYDITSRKWSTAHYALRFSDDTDFEATQKLVEQTLKLKNRDC